MRFLKGLFSAILTALILTACAGAVPKETAAGAESASPDALTFTDALGYKTTIESWERVVSLYANFTET